MKVVITDYIEPDLNWEVEEFAKRGFEFEYGQLKFAPMEKLIEFTRDADVVVVNMVPVTPELIAGWDKCKLVIRHGVGYDNVNVQALTDAGIPLCYIPDYCVDEVAEQAIALIFACARQVPQSRKVLESWNETKIWDAKSIMPMFKMAGRTLGIIGCGRMGSRVYEKLKTFGFNFLICDPYLSDERKQELGIEVVDMKTVLKNADFITMHTPLNESTYHMINAEALAMMKPTTYVINTARGGVVDADAVAEAIKNGTIAGAGIDVFEKEPPRDDYPLMNLPRAIVTPHLAWYSEDAAMKIREIIVIEADRMAAGQSPRYCVNPSVLAKG